MDERLATTHDTETLRDDPLSYPTASPDARVQPDRGSPPSTPRWVKVFGLIAVVLLLLFVGLHVTGYAPTHMPPSSGTEHGLQSS